MRCYQCRETNGHLINCPNLKKPKKTIEAIRGDKELEDFIAQDGFVPPSRRIIDPTKETRMRLAFLPLSTEEGKTVPSLGTTPIRAQPQLPSKPYRLWIDENVALCFLLEAVYIGVDGGQFVSLGRIPAMMFRTGRWPLPKEPDKNQEFGIDLSTWRTIMPGMTFTLMVYNQSAGCMPFRAAMEVWVI